MGTLAEDIKIREEDRLRERLSAHPLAKDALRIATRCVAIAPSDAIFTQRLRDGVRLSAQSHGPLFQCVQEARTALAITPEVSLFLDRDPDGENASIIFDGTRLILTFLGNILNLIADPQQLKAIIGHELGHYVYGHLAPSVRLETYLGDVYAIVAGWNDRPPLSAAEARLLKHTDLNSLLTTFCLLSQVRELNADRVGLVVAGDLGASIVGLMKLRAGPVSRFGTYDANSYLQQADELMANRDGYFLPADWSTPYPINPLRAKALELFYYSDTYSRIGTVPMVKYVAADFPAVLPALVPLTVLESPARCTSAPEAPPNHTVRPDASVDRYDEDLFLALVGETIADPDDLVAQRKDQSFVLLISDATNRTKARHFLRRASIERQTREYERLRHVIASASHTRKRHILKHLINLLQAERQVEEWQLARLQNIARRIKAVEVCAALLRSAFGTSGVPEQETRTTLDLIDMVAERLRVGTDTVSRIVFTCLNQVALAGNKGKDVTIPGLGTLRLTGSSKKQRERLTSGEIVRLTAEKVGASERSVRKILDAFAESAGTCAGRGWAVDLIGFGTLVLAR